LVQVELLELDLPMQEIVVATQYLILSLQLAAAEVVAEAVRQMAQMVVLVVEMLWMAALVEQAQLVKEIMLVL
jgi:hypothetical protein